jgi:parallel beta-helix repeat protein
MSTQSGKTFIDAYGTSYANITNATSQNYKTLEKICIVRNNATGALFNSGNFINIKDCDFIACNTPLNSITAGNLIEDSSFICSNLQVQGVRTECKNCLFLSNNFSLAGEDMTLDSCEIRNTVGFLSTTSSKNIKILDCNFINNSQGMSISSSTDFLFKGCTFTDNGRSNSTSDRRIITSQGWGGEVNFINTTHDVANPSSNFAVFSTNNTVINSFNENGNGILIKRYPGYTIQTDSSVTQSGNGISWRFNITSITAFDQFAPARLNIAKVACRANKLVTFKAWVRRDNTNLSGRIIVPAKQLTGVSETSASITAAANTWQELTITFTPTEQGVLEVFADAWTTTTNTNFWVDNLTITQEA